MLGLLTFLPPMSLHLVPSREAWIAFIIKAVNSDNVIAPIRIHIIPNKRPQRVLGVLSPYLMRKRNQISLRFEDSLASIRRGLSNTPKPLRFVKGSLRIVLPVNAVNASRYTGNLINHLSLDGNWKSICKSLRKYFISNCQGLLKMLSNWTTRLS